MTECEEVAAAIARRIKPHLASLTEALDLARLMMPQEDPAGTIVNNVAWALYRDHDQGQGVRP